jgi:hypothetical protein
LLSHSSSSLGMHAVVALWDSSFGLLHLRACARAQTRGDAFCDDDGAFLISTTQYTSRRKREAVATHN